MEIKRRRFLRTGLVGASGLAGVTAASGQPDPPAGTGGDTRDSELSNHLDELAGALDAVGDVARTLDAALVVDHRRERIDALLAEVSDLGLGRGRERSLTATLRSARSANERAGDAAVAGRAKQVENHLRATENVLGAFGNQVRANRGRVIPANDAEHLLATVRSAVRAADEPLAIYDGIDEPTTTRAALDRVDALTGDVADVAAAIERIDGEDYEPTVEIRADGQPVVAVNPVVAIPVGVGATVVAGTFLLGGTLALTQSAALASGLTALNEQLWQFAARQTAWIEALRTRLAQELLERERDEEARERAARVLRELVREVLDDNPELKADLREVYEALHLVLFETTFEDVPVGSRPEQWTYVTSSSAFEAFEVQSGGAAGSERALRLRTNPFQSAPGPGEWGSRARTPPIEGQASAVQWFWKKEHERDPENYGALDERGPTFILRNERGAGFVHLKLGAEDGYLNGTDYPLGVGIGQPGDSVYLADLYEAGEFVPFVLDLDFDAETFDLHVGGEEVGTFQFVNPADDVHRAEFKVGGWGVSGDSEVDEFRVR